jgi:branched-chain amino acid transport system substrate-binding protein
MPLPFLARPTWSVRRLLVALAALSLLTSGCGTRLEGTERANARAGLAGGASTLDSASGTDGTGVGAGARDATGTSVGVAGGNGSPAGGSSSGTTGGTGGRTGGGSGGTTHGSGTSGGTTSGGSTGSTTAARSPILIASVGTFSGPGGAAWAPGVDGLQVWVKDVNRRGGLDGHPVKLMVADDGSDPARHLSLVKDFVENKKVFAFAYTVVSTTYSKAVDDYLTKHGVSVVGGDASSTVWETSKPYFPVGTTQSAALFSHMKAAKRQHPDFTKIAVLTCREAKGCTDASTGWPEAGKKVGFETVYKGEVSIAQPDFTAECLNARNAGAQMMFVAVDPNSVRRLGASCTRQGYKPVYVLPSGVISSDQAGDPNLEGAIGVNLVMPWMSRTTPGAQEWQAAVQRYNPGLKLNITTPFGWASGKMLERAATGRLGAVPARAALIAGLLSFKGETLAGIVPPLTFTATRKTSECWFTLTFNGGTWKEGGGGRAACP